MSVKTFNVFYGTIQVPEDTSARKPRKYAYDFIGYNHKFVETGRISGAKRPILHFPRYCEYMITS